MSKKILLVEDEAIIAMNTARMIEKHGYEVVTAYKGEKAVEMMGNDSEISLILMDIDLGNGMDGTEAAKEILSKKDIPVVFLSSHTEPEVVGKTEKITSYGYVVKNSGATVLDASIKMAFKLFDAKMEHKQKEEDLRISEYKYRILFENMNVSFCLHEAIYDENGNPADYRYLDMNPMFLNNLGCTADAIRGHTAKELFPNTEQSWIDIFGKVAKTGESVAYQNYSRELNQWFNTFVFSPEKDKFAAFFIDITAQKKAEEALQEKTDLLERIFDSNVDLISLTDLEGNFTLVGKAHEILGYDKKYLLGKNVMAFVHPDDVDTVTRGFTEFLQSGQNRKVEYRYKRINGEYLWFETIGTILRDKKGNPEQILFNTRNITEHKQQEEILKKTKRLLSDSQRIGKVGGWEFNIDTLEQNWTEETFRIHEVDLNYENTVEKGIDFYTPDSKPIIENAVKRAIEFNEPYDLELRIKTAKGNLRHVHTIGKIDLANRRLFGFFQDITETKLAEEELRRFKIISDNAVYGKAIADLQGNLLYTNRFFANIHGYNHEELIGKNLSLFHNEHQAEEVKHLNTLMIQEGHFDPTTVWHCHKDGTVFPMLMSGILLKDNNGSPQYFAFSAVDITDLKRAEEELQESEVKLQSLALSFSDVVYTLDTQQRYTGVYGNWVEKAGLTQEFFLGKTSRDIFGEELAHVHQEANQQALKGTSTTYEWSAPSADGVAHHQTSVSPLRNSQGEIIGVSGVGRDITEHKRAKEKLLEALKEKDFLMDELNHRVKNNLAMVLSLISLKDSETEEDLSDLKRRIDAIKLVHEKLHQRSDIERIEVREYFQELLESIFSSTSRKDVELVNNIEEVSIPTKTVIPLGLVVNEITTNAIKYGFTSDKKARFIVELNKEEEHSQYVLILSNTGNPFPEDIRLDNPETMGLQLISTLVAQLDGTIELQKKPNPVFTIRFPIED